MKKPQDSTQNMKQKNEKNQEKIKIYQNEQRL